MFCSVQNKTKTSFRLNGVGEFLQFACQGRAIAETYHRTSEYANQALKQRGERNGTLYVFDVF